MKHISALTMLLLYTAIVQSGSPIAGRLMLIPENNQTGCAQSRERFKRMNGMALPTAVSWIQVCAYNRASADWARDGNRELDRAQPNERFCAHLPLTCLQHLDEGNLLVLRWGNKEICLTCCNLGTRYSRRTFAGYLKDIVFPYASVVDWRDGI